MGAVFELTGATAMLLTSFCAKGFATVLGLAGFGCRCQSTGLSCCRASVAATAAETKSGMLA